MRPQMLMLKVLAQRGSRSVVLEKENPIQPDTKCMGREYMCSEIACCSQEWSPTILRESGRKVGLAQPSPIQQHNNHISLACAAIVTGGARPNTTNERRS